MKKVNYTLINVIIYYKIRDLKREYCKIMLIGPVNVGKSTLFNKIIDKERAIVLILGERLEIYYQMNLSLMVECLRYLTLQDIRKQGNREGWL